MPAFDAKFGIVDIFRLAVGTDSDQRNAAKHAKPGDIGVIPLAIWAIHF